MSGILPRKTDVSESPAEQVYLGLTGENASKVFSTLVSTTSRRILASLHESPGAASELADHVDTSLQNVIYHLRSLQEAGLVEVVDTWYSPKGREMKVYAPVHESMVLFAGETEDLDRVERDMRASP